MFIRLLVTVLCVILSTGALYSKTSHSIPKEAQNMLNTYFKGVEIVNVTSNKKNRLVTVSLKNQITIVFNEEGHWTSANRKFRTFPKVFIDSLPKKMTTYIARKHPNKAILKIRRNTIMYIVEIPDINLYFDFNGQIKNSESNRDD